jgi:hypothetical protein
MKKATINALVVSGALITFIPSLVPGSSFTWFFPEGGGYRGGVGALGCTDFFRSHEVGLENRS